MPEVTEPIDEPVTAQEELADFKSGFSDEPPTETPEVIKEPAPEAPPEPKTKVLLESEYTALLESAAQVSAMKATVDKQFGTAFGKLGGMERTIQQLQSTPTGQMPEVTDEDMADLRDYGDELPATLKNALNKALSKVKVGGSAPIDEAALEPIVQKRVSEELTKLEQKMEDKAIRRIHPDFDEVRNSENFHKWFAQLPDDKRQELAGSYESDVVSKYVTDYKATKVKVEAKPAAAQPKDNSRKELLEASIAPRGTSAATAGKKTEQEEFMSGFNSK